TLAVEDRLAQYRSGLRVELGEITLDLFGIVRNPLEYFALGTGNIKAGTGKKRGGRSDAQIRRKLRELAALAGLAVGRPNGRRKTRLGGIKQAVRHDELCGAAVEAQIGGER